MALSVIGATLVVALIARGGCRGSALPAATSTAPTSNTPTSNAPTSPTTAPTTLAPTAPTTLAPTAPILDIPTFTVRAPASKVGLQGEGGAYRARFSRFEGALRLNGDEVAGGSFELALTSSSVTAARDDVSTSVRSADFLDAERYPKVTFSSTRIVAAEGKATHEITGNLTLHGVLKPLTFDATIRRDGDTVTLDATVPIDRRDFGIGSAGTPEDPLATKATLTLELKLGRR